ncbi:hypothetical protein T05_11614 [Trichinella murrelli]|uniref:Uncharacterized protein n=1 Tax=Trichinella murrelli TaxID=144512 RepID=A0A0V0TBH7_9BILA|nr:hypothetical protein T05_11614 [Trichinella murrelli]
MALAFLPVNLVPAGFEILNFGTSGQVEALFQYFQREGPVDHEPPLTVGLCTPPSKGYAATK